MSALDALTHWLFEDGPTPSLTHEASFAEALRLLDELPAEPADALAALIEAELSAHPQRAAAFLPDAGPRAAALLTPWALPAVAAPAELLDEVCAWLFEGAPRPQAELAEIATCREALVRLAGAYLGDEGSRLRFAAQVLDPMDEWLEDCAPIPLALPAVEPAVKPEVEPDLGAQLNPRPPRRGPWLLLALAAAALAFFLLRPQTPTPTPSDPIGGQHPEALTTAALVVPPAWPDAGRPPPAALPETALRPTMLPVPAGSFLMGSPAGEAERNPDETRHQVTLTRAFYLGRTEWTQAQWQALMGSNPSRFQGNPGDEERPVENISWYDALAALNTLSLREGLPACYTLTGCSGGACERVDFVGLDCAGYRLPSEAEWEHAARAGTPTALWRGDLVLRDVHHAPVLDTIAWYSGNSGVERGGLQCAQPEKMQYPATQCGTHPVGRKEANPLGFHDILGNVWEWTGDGFGPHTEAAQIDPLGLESSDRKVTKGCDWFRDARFCRAANRYRPRPNYRSSVIGLRPARTIPGR